jgi:hypothetical protein
MMTLTPELEKKLREIAEHNSNVFFPPKIEIRPGTVPSHSHLHFIYPIGKVAGNAIDSSSLEGMRDDLTEVMGRRMGVMWIGIYGNFFHIWASYRDE